MTFDSATSRFFLFLVTILILSLFLYIAVPRLLKREWSIKYIPVPVSLILVFITIFFLQSHSVLFKQESSVSAKILSVKKSFWNLFGQTDEQKYFIDSNFILVNTSLDPALVPGNEGSYDDSAYHIIANRRKMADLFQFLGEIDTAIDLVVCDIFFLDSTVYDKRLIAGMKRLQDKNKFVLAYNPDFAAINPAIYKQLDVSVFGDVTKVKDEPFYFSHELFNHQDMPSLPYSMYLKLADHSINSPGKNIFKEDGKIVFKNFITEFYYTDEKKIYKDIQEEYNERSVGRTRVDTTLSYGLPSRVYNLGRTVTDDGKQEILDLLAFKGKRHKNIVFIGNFRDEYTDKHMTAHGNLYGATILLNEFHFIQEGNHKISVFGLIMYIIVLFTGYYFILLFLLWRTIIRKEKKLSEYKRKDWAFIWKWLKSVATFFLDESFYLMLVLLALIVNIFFRKMINVMGILYFFLIFSLLLKFFIKHMEIKPSS